MTEASVPPAPFGLPPRPPPRRRARRRRRRRSRRGCGTSRRSRECRRCPCRRARTRRAPPAAPRLLPCRPFLGRLGVEEAARRVGQEQRVVLLEVLRVDVGRIVGNRRRPRAGLLAELFDRLRGNRDRAVDEAARVAEHQDLARLCRLGWRRRGKRRHHLRHVVGAGRLSNGGQIAAAAARGGRRGAGRARAASTTAAGCACAASATGRGGWRRQRQCRVQRGTKLVGRHRPGLAGVGRVVPLLERALHFRAGDRAVGVGVERGPQGRVNGVGRGGGRRRRRGLGLAQGRGQQHAGGDDADECGNSSCHGVEP